MPSIEQAKKDWKTRVYKNDEVVAYLEDDTWHGVAIAFFLGYGFTLDESIKIIKTIDY